VSSRVSESQVRSVRKDFMRTAAGDETISKRQNDEGGKFARTGRRKGRPCMSVPIGD